MKTYLMIFAIVFSFASCKSKKETTSTKTPDVKEATTDSPKINGKVSHQYKKDGCSAVVIISSADGTITLIPMENSLPKEFDKDGAEINFSYMVLRMPQPEGCSIGQPAKLSDVTKKK